MEMTKCPMKRLRVRKTPEIINVIDAMLLLKRSLEKEKDCKRLHGVYIKKTFVDYDGIPRVFRGRVDDMGVNQEPYRFKVTYSDGDSETMSLSEVESCRCQSGACAT
jgi:hypothetical protein